MSSELQEKVLDLRAVFGLKATVITPATATDGAFVEMDIAAEPGSGTLIHYHPEQVETYQVLEGTLEVFRDGRWRAVPAGDSVTVPLRAIHGFRNATGAPVRFLNVHRPALAFQDHLETLDRLIRAGKIRGTKDPRSLIYMAMSAAKHRPDVAVKPPQAVIRGLAFIGRLLGYELNDAAPLA
jgi:mannose-6-phosphate isomerase-like protein (cupin superfamily)